MEGKKNTSQTRASLCQHSCRMETNDLLVSELKVSKGAKGRSQQVQRVGTKILRREGRQPISVSTPIITIWLV